MMITRKFIFSGRSIRGGWSAAQVNSIGIKWPLERGWIDRACGRTITHQQAERFIMLRNAHIGVTLDLLEPEQHDHLTSIIHETP